jgi:multidrug efflux pump subunit AcrB
MNIVSFALRRPISLVVAVAAIALAALLALHRMPRDIFPSLGVPIIYVAQTYGGLDPAQMEGFIVNYYEYHFLYISGIEHIESKSIQGVALIKLQFHPGTNMPQALAETVSYVERSRAFMPPGTLPPFVLRFDAGSVPVGDLVFSSKTRSIGELQDAALFRVRPLFATLPGVSAPPPFGSSERTIVINADPERLRAYNMSPEELVRALGSGNIITPSGNVPIGNLWPMVPVNTVVSDIKELNDIPIRSEGAKTVFLRDVGSVEDSTDIQTSYALVDGRRTVYIPVTKQADASTLAVVGLVKQNLARFQAVLPGDIRVSYEFDQSPYVTRAIYGLLFEGGIGALLTGLMVLLFLRDWRSALIVVLNIPLAILWASLALWVSGQTVNIMTLGGLALAVGILVDEATVTIENIHTHLARSRGLARAARDATVETTVPRFLAMVCILAVFIPAFFMSGAARNLFVPLSLAVGFSMVGSFLLSSTLVPVLGIWILRAQRRHDRSHGEQSMPEVVPPPALEDLPCPAAGGEVSETVSTSPGNPEATSLPSPRQPPTPIVEAGEVSATGDSVFERFHRRYARIASLMIERRRVVVLLYLAICGLLMAIVGNALGTEIFPVVDTGQFELRLRAQPGTRIDRTEQIALQALDAIKREVGPENVAISLGFVGTQPPNFAINTIYLWSSGPEEAMLQIQLKRGTGIRVEELKEKLRAKLPHELPGVRFSFEPSDIVSRVMSFGAPTPIEVAVSGTDIAEIRRYAEQLKNHLAKVPMLRDQAFEQELDYPIIKVDFIRELAGMLGLTAENVAQALVPATSSSRYTLPNYWADPKSGIGYQVQVEIPGSRINSMEEVRIVPIARRDGKQVAVRDLATVNKETTLGEYDRYNMQRMLTLSANIAGEDLGSAAKSVRQAIDATGKPPKAVTVTVRGQVRPMEHMFDGLQSGLLVAIGTILLLLTAYFQSFRLSTAVIIIIPAAVAGAVVMLWLTHTTLNIQSYMGTIMAVGVAVANSILLVTFAERSRLEGREASAAAIEGASSRLRPIVMTGAAMVAGMIPMALGLSEGGEQTAPLARAVIGGLSGAMFATLLVLPAIFTMLTSNSSRASASLDPEDPQSAHFAGRDLYATDHGHDSDHMEREMTAALPEDHQRSQLVEARDLHAPGGDQAENEMLAEPRSEQPQIRHDEARDPRPTEDDPGSEQTDRDETE